MLRSFASNGDNPWGAAIDTSLSIAQLLPQSFVTLRDIRKTNTKKTRFALPQHTSVILQTLQIGTTSLLVTALFL
jgi:hypothetical protein